MPAPAHARRHVLWGLLCSAPSFVSSGVATSPQEEGRPPRCSHAILAAARYGDEPQLRRNLEVERLDCVDDLGRTPLHLAAQHNQRGATLQLLAAGAHMSRDAVGQTPLHSAAVAGHVNLTELLLESGAYIELRDAAQRTPLHHAVREGHGALARALLDRGASINARDGDRRTPLHYSAQRDDFFNISELLCERGAHVELADVVGYRALHFACRMSQLETAAFLLQRGADLYAMDVSGWNPLVQAAAAGHASMVNFLVVWTLRPETYPAPDPALVAAGEQDSGSVAGLPTWLLALAVSVAVGLLFISPCLCLVRRFGRERAHFQVTAGDVEVEEFLDEVFEYLVNTKGAQEKLCQQWDKIPARTLNNLHRPKT